MKIRGLRLNVHIATHIGTVIILVFSFVATVFVVNVGEKIIKTTPNSKIFDSQKKAQKIIQEK